MPIDEPGVLASGVGALAAKVGVEATTSAVAVAATVGVGGSAVGVGVLRLHATNSNAATSNKLSRLPSLCNLRQCNPLKSSPYTSDEGQRWLIAQIGQLGFLASQTRRP